MKILYLHQYFLTPEQGGAVRSYYLAKALVDKGYEVEMVTSHNEKGDKTEMVDGIKVHYLSVYYNNNLSFLGRAFSFLKFIIKSYHKAKLISDIDLCYASSTPLTIGLVAIRLKNKFNIPFYFEVRDLWPEAPIQMGVIKNFFIKRFLYFLEKRIYKNAEKIIALSPGIKDGVEKIVPYKPVYILPNISDCNLFHPEIKNPLFEEKYKVKEKFVVTYFGAIGKVNHLSYMIDVVNACKQKGLDGIHFIITGKGSELESIKSLAKKYKLDNVSFLDFMNKHSLSEVLNVTDATYISYADKPVLQSNSPNKFFDAIAAGKLCIVNTKGWIMNLIEEKDCGFYANPNRPEDFIEKVTPFLNDRSSLILCQNNARKLAETYFSREVQTEKFLKLFNKEGKIEPISPSAYTLTA
jgi:glycosyltransferase involved in cell wall biosynthesis